MNYNQRIKKPRIAFCFSWQVRTLHQTFSFFKKNLFDSAKEQWFQYDVFCAVEEDEDVGKVNLLNPTKVEKIKSNKVKEIIDQKWGHFIKYEYAEKYGYSLKDETPNVLQQLYKICQSIKLKNIYKSEKNISYDMVFKLRFDTPFPRKLNFKNILSTITKSDKIVLCNRNRLIPSAKFLIKIEDFYFIMDDKASDILWDIFDNRDICFKWFEIKNKKLNRIFEKIDPYRILWKKRPVLYKMIWIPFTYIYSIFFQPYSTEILVLNYFKNKKCEVNTDEYITVWFIRNGNNYKKLDFKTHTKKWIFKKSIYEV